MNTDIPSRLTRALLGALALAASAAAQTSAPAAGGAAQQLESFEVTGTRIRGLVGEADFSPVIKFDRVEIEALGLTSMGEISRLIPQAFSQGSYDGVGFGGQHQGQSQVSDGSLASVLTQRTNINLRGLGAANTLVLVDGRRLSRSGNIRGSDGYDLTGIPVSAIERVEVLTDGASAIYGSDALGGVVNIILRKNYTGTEVTFSYENTFSSDTAVKGVNLNHSLTRGPLSLSLTASYQQRHAFAAVDRTFSSTDDWSKLGGTSSLASTGPSFGAGGFAVGAGIVQASSGNLPGRTTPYAVIPDGAGAAAQPASAYVTVAGDSLGVPAYTGDRARYVNLISPQFTRTIGFRGGYDLKGGARLSLSGGYNETRTHIEGMPVNFRNSIVVPANYPGNPFGVQVRLNKTFWELGPIQGEKFTTNSNLNFAGTLTGRFGDGWRYELGSSWNRSRLVNESALDPVLDTNVSAPLIAAQRLVLFYDSRSAQPNDLALLRSMLRPGNATDRTDTVTWSASADGPLPWLRLPAGPVQFAAGAESTTEKIATSQSIPDLPTINLSLLGGFRRTLNSAYAETRVPVIGAAQRVPLVQRFDLTGAIRRDDYSDVGGDNSPRYGAQLRPFKWLLFRATRNHSFRAPGIQALYRPVTQSTNANTTGFIDRVRNELVTGIVQTRIGGNLDLRPETAVSDNVGVVFELPFRLTRGLSISVDHVKLNYRDQIAGLSTLQEWSDLFPERLIRDTAGAQPGRVIGVDTRSTNISRQIVETYDYQLNLQRPTPWGNLSARVAATEYRRVDSIRIPGAAPVTSLHLRPTRLSWQAFLTRGAYSGGVSGFYQENSWVQAARTQTLLASVIEWNVHASYDFGGPAGARRDGIAGLWRNPLADTKLSLTVNNVFNREPPHRQGNAGFGVTDPRMARYGLTLRKKF
jgi:iron complex outermembrane receptor protein